MGTWRQQIQKENDSKARCTLPATFPFGVDGKEAPFKPRLIPICFGIARIPPSAKSQHESCWSHIYAWKKCLLYQSWVSFHIGSVLRWLWFGFARFDGDIAFDIAVTWNGFLQSRHVAISLPLWLLLLHWIMALLSLLSLAHTPC